MNTRIVIADDHPLMLHGLTDFLKSNGHNVIGSANDGREAYNLIVKLKPEIAILDIRMPYLTGIEIANECKKNNISTKIILITFDKEEALYDKAQELNIYGYILKEFAVDEIEACLESVKENIPYFSNEIVQFLDSSTSTTKENLLAPLTKSEQRIVKLISQNNSSSEIAALLNISIRTVDKHRENIVTKLELDRRPNSLSIWANVNKMNF